MKRKVCGVPMSLAISSLIAAVVVDAAKSASHAGSVSLGSSFGFAASTAILPTDYTVYQRRDDNTGTMKFVVRLVDDAPLDLIVKDWYRLDVRYWKAAGSTRGVALGWTTVDNFTLNPATGIATGSIEAVAGGWYSVQLRVIKNGVLSTRPYVSIPRVGVGEVFVTAGQSNATNWGESPSHANRFATSEDRIAAMNYLNGAWQPGNQYPLPAPDHTLGGSPWPRMANDLVAALGVPVGFVQLGYGGTSIQVWQAPDPADPRYAGPVAGIGIPRYADGTGRVKVNTADYSAGGKSMFENLSNAVNYIAYWLGPPRAILWVQGEADNIGTSFVPGDFLLAPLSREEYRLYLRQLIVSLRHQTGLNTPWFISPTAFVCNNNANMMNVINAQIETATGIGEQAFLGPATYDLDTSNSDGNRNGCWGYPGQPGSPAAAYDPSGTRDAWHGNALHLSWAGLEIHGKRWANVLLNTVIGPNGHPIRP